MQFTSTATRLATADPGLAVNAAATAERPLAARGGQGTGKTGLARKIAAACNLPEIAWQVTSTTRAQLGLCDFDPGRRRRDSRPGDGRIPETASTESARIAAPCRKLLKFCSRIPKYSKHVATSREAATANLAVRRPSPSMDSLLPESKNPND